MKQGFSTVPFKVDDENAICEWAGLAKFSAAGIVLEFEQEFLGMMKTGGIKEARIPLGDILDLQFGKGFMGMFASITVRVKNLGILAGLPAKKGRLKIKIGRADRAAAIEAVENMQQLLNNGQPELLPTTVRHLFGDEAETKKLE